MIRKALYRSVIVALLLVFSCGDSVEAPIGLIERMKMQACEGDLDGFYNNIDKLSVDANLKKAILESLDNDSISPEDLKETEEIIIPSLLVFKWEVLNREIKLGQEGIYCNMEVLNTTDNDGNLRLIFPNGKTSVWGFEAKNGRLLLVYIIDDEPFDFAKLDLGLISNKKNSLENTSGIAQSRKLNKKTFDQKVSETKEETKPLTTKSINSDVASVNHANKIDRMTKEDSLHDIKDLKQETVQSAEKVSPPIENGSYDFRKAWWGMTKDQVRALERINPVSETLDTLVFNGVYNGYKAEIYYI